jgi:hypothetical protein
MKFHKSFLLIVFALMLGCNSIPKPNIAKIKENDRFDQNFEAKTYNYKTPIASTFGIIIFTLTLCLLMKKNGNK